MVYAHIVQAGSKLHNEISSCTGCQCPQVPENTVVFLAVNPLLQPFHFVHPILHIHGLPFDYRFSHFCVMDPGPPPIDRQLGKNSQDHGGNHDHFRPQGQEPVKQQVKHRGQTQCHQREPGNIHRDIRPHFACHSVLHGIEYPFPTPHGHEPHRQQRIAGIFGFCLGGQRCFHF